jgi:RNA polymerase sigma-70 factor (ECF subfamily)
LLFIARRIDPDQADDICAECFEIAWRKFNPTQPFGPPWLYKTARNLLRNAYRKDAREARLVEQIRFEGSLREDRSAEIAACITGLPQAEKQLIMLTYWGGMSAAEIAAVDGCSEQAVWKRLSRARARLRAHLAAS